MCLYPHPVSSSFAEAFFVAGRRPLRLCVVTPSRYKRMVRGVELAAQPKKSPWVAVRTLIGPHQKEFLRLCARRPKPRGGHRTFSQARRRCVQRPRAETSIALSHTKVAK